MLFIQELMMAQMGKIAVVQVQILQVGCGAYIRGIMEQSHQRSQQNRIIIKRGNAKRLGGDTRR